MAETSMSPADHDGDENMDDRSDPTDYTNLDETTIGQDDDLKDEKLPNGRHFVESDEPTDYSLFSNPFNLGVMRQRLFDVEDTIELSQTDFEQYFPYVDNIWRKSKSGEPAVGKDEVTDVYWCRRKRASGVKPYTPKPTPEGKTSRKKRVRDETTCPMAIRVVKKDGLSKMCIIQRVGGPEVRHTHNIEYMDSIKRNSGIMDVARREAIRAFLPGSVFWKMQEEPQKMEDAGGKFMKISDVRNVQYAWRQENPNLTLKAHQGYSQANKGPKPKDSSQTHITAPQTLHQKQQQQFNASLPHPHPQPSQMPITPVDPATRNVLQYPDHAREFLESYLPRHSDRATRPHITLTWATSLDSRISLLPNVQTAISGPETKAMTHYLRSRHDAIIIGVKTAISDNPSLNCRLFGSGGYGGPLSFQQPRPVIIDPQARLQITRDMKVLQVVSEGRAKPPWIVVTPSANLDPAAIQTLRSFGGEYLMIHDVDQRTGRLNWEAIFNVLFKEGLKSIMIEGGGTVMSELLHPRYNDWIDSIILTIAPAFFGRSGVEVSPDTAIDARNQQPIMTRLKNVRWQPMGDADVVMCGHLRYEIIQTNGNLPGIQEIIQQSTDPRGPYPAHINGHSEQR